MVATVEEEAGKKQKSASVRDDLVHSDAPADEHVWPERTGYGGKFGCDRDGHGRLWFGCSKGQHRVSVFRLFSQELIPYAEEEHHHRLSVRRPVELASNDV